MNYYVDTRTSNPIPQRFSDVIIQGIAPSGGLFVPQNIPQISLEHIKALAQQSYANQAAQIYQLFDIDIADKTITQLMHQAYGNNFDHELICPITSLSGNIHILELFHGPTSAFKDMALQCLPLFFSEALAHQNNGRQSLILVATSGDTGKAALEGFKNKERILMGVFYPHGGVSEMQYLQMATQQGDNLFVSAVHGNFDDCQRGLKQIFGDHDFAHQLAHRHQCTLSSANSINWGRLMPQIVYYISAYARMVAAGNVELGSPIDICVPTGNFGNILAAYYSKMMGVPIHTLICASNENDVLADFINTGVYDIQERPFVLTPSPSMDILVSSNLERQIFESSGRDAGEVAHLMNELQQHQRFTVSTSTLAQIQHHFVAGYADAATCFNQIRSSFEDDGYLMDPHTAVALAVGKRHQSTRPLLVASTAHWAKFGTNVARALHGLQPGDSLPEPYRSSSELEINRLIQRYAQQHGCNTSIPHNLDTLEREAIRFTETVEGDVDALKSCVLQHLSHMI